MSPSFGMRRSPTGADEQEEAEEGEEFVPLGDDEVVDLSAEQGAEEIEAVLDSLDQDLVGLKPVKTRIREIARLLLVDRTRQRYGLSTSTPTLHMCFTGPPGTGKTTVARRMAELLRNLGYLRKGHLVAASREDLVGEYVGHTAPKTKEVLTKAAGGVLFIDEAYYLHRPDNERDYGQEAIEMLLQAMENQRHDLVVILAGYKEYMDRFFMSNPGMASRVAHHIAFPDYTLDELLAIGDMMLEEEQYQLSDEARDAFREYLKRRKEQPRFANARSVRNGIDRFRLRQANRLVEKAGKVTKEDLMRIEAEDVLASRVFEEEAEAGPTSGPASETGSSSEPESPSERSA